MDIVVLFVIYAVTTLGVKLFSKLCSNAVVGSSKAKYSLYLAINGIVACIFFWISAGFKLSYNLATLIYSLVYAVVIAMTLVSSLIAYKLITISSVNIISSSFGVVGSLVVGYLLFDESMGWRKILRILVLLVAVVFVFIDSRKTPPDEKEKKLAGKAGGSKLLLIAVIGAIIISGIGNTVVTKAFAVSESVTDENSFFFLTNLALTVGAMIAFLIACLRKRDEFKGSLELLKKPSWLISVVGSTVCSNIGSLVSLWIIARMDISIYSPISSALGIIVGVVGSLIFREKLGLFSYLAAIVACIALII